ncbi:MAG: NAD(+)/NADH kinase [Planctomycetes bacterium]|nr:NAD(+)/NADH kinase [Planctomycetota bacterium]
MRVLILGEDIGSFRDTVAAAGLNIVDERPDVVISYGGDGGFIGSERLHPGIPKVGIRHESATKKCPTHQDGVLMERLRSGELEETSLMKLEATFNGRSVDAVNDIIVRNGDVRSAVRFRVHLNGHPVTEELIADGVIVCTPFGSSAYFRSVTRTVIRTGIGVAINNCTDLLNHLVIGEDEVIRVELTRGPATLAADNDPATYAVADGADIVVKKAPRPFRVLGVDSLRCSECRYVHAPRRRY